MDMEFVEAKQKGKTIKYPGSILWIVIDQNGNPAHLSIGMTKDVSIQLFQLYYSNKDWMELENMGCKCIEVRWTQYKKEKITIDRIELGDKENDKVRRIQN